MSRRTGIIVATPNKLITDEPLAYSSNNSHLLVDTTPGKDFLGIKEFTGWPSMSVSTSLGETKQTIFYQMPHKLPFIPKVSVKFFARQVPAAMSGYEGTYSAYLFIGGIPFNEQILFRVDSRNVYLIHRVSSISGGPVQSYTSLMQDGLYRTKYSIYLNEALDEPYESAVILS